METVLLKPVTHDATSCGVGSKKLVAQVTHDTTFLQLHPNSHDTHDFPTNSSHLAVFFQLVTSCVKDFSYNKPIIDSNCI